MPEAKQNTSKLAEMFARASVFTALIGIAVDVVRLSMALLSFRGFDTPSLPAQGEQRRSSFFNIRRDISIICTVVDRIAPAVRSRKSLITFVTDRPGYDLRNAH